MNLISPVPEHPAAAPATPRWHGALEGMHDELIFGWALDGAQPEARVVIELCLNQDVIGAVVADIARTDLHDSFAACHPAADVCHGFIADIGQLKLDDRSAITARIANTGVTLAGAITLEAPHKAPVGAVSTVVGDGGLRLHGWAVDPSRPGRTLTVRALLGHETLAEAEANLMHPMARAYVEGPHGFDLALPMALADGEHHQIRVVDADGNELNGSPLSICCGASGLQQLLPGTPDSVLHRVADMYERHLPRSLSMQGYAAWSAAFDEAPPATATPLSLAVIVTGAGDASITRASLASTDQQVRVFDGAPFPELLAAALAAGCELVASVRAGDTLAPHALSHMQAAFLQPAAQIAYADSIYQGHPWFKPAWNPDYALASDYPLELLVLRSAAIKFAADTPAALAWGLLAQYWSEHGAIVHVPRVLYQFNTPLSPVERTQRDAAATAALATREPASTLAVIGQAPQPACAAARRLQPALSADARQQRVSLIIPTRDHAALLERCISTIRRHTPWLQLEIIVIDNGSVEEETARYFAALAAEGVRVLPMPGPFNYADLNNRAVAQASGEIIGLINNDIEALHDGWLDEIMAQLMRPGVGAVGAKLLWPNGMVQHGGVLLGVGNVAGHFGNRLADADWGDHGRNQLVQQVSAVTAACLFLRKRDYEAVGGMDAAAFPVAFNDVDLCLKLRAAGKAIVWTPHAKLLHAESASRGHEDTPQKRARAQREIAQLRQRWGHVLTRDPAYHPSLNLDPNSHAFGGLALPPRSRAPRNGALINQEETP